MRLTIGDLRHENPEWGWRAIRDGWGWQYEGAFNGHTVTVRAYAVLCGPSDDDFTTQWRVPEAGCTYACWHVMVGRHIGPDAVDALGRWAEREGVGLAAGMPQGGGRNG